jgi:MFS-type transporter involved in bile tolerance (Atg22 family)
VQLRFPRAELRALLRPRTTAERNVRNVLVDGVGVGIVTGVGTFLPVFLARLGASSLLVGLITSLPALTGALLAVPIGRFLERQRNIVPWYSGMRVFVLWSYAIFGLLPFLIPLELVPWTVIAIWALATMPSTFVNVAFTVVMGGVAGPKNRFAVMSLRWSSLGAVTAITVTLVGLTLEQFSFPLNYQIVFIGSFFGGLLSFLFSRSIALPDNASAEAPEVKAPLGQRLRAALGAAAEHPAFARFTASAFVFRCGVAMSIPLLPLYWVREVGASDSWIGIISTANSGVLLVAYWIWSTLSRRIGVGGVLLATSFGMALYPLAVASTESVLLLAVFAGCVGFFAAGNDLVNFDLVLSTIPREHQATYVGAYQTLQNTALFIMPLVGTLIADAAGIRTGLIIAGVLRLIGAGLYLALGIGRSAPKPEPAQSA